MKDQNNLFGIEKSLEKLGLKNENKGVSTGANYFATGDLLTSYSPTDGKPIANVTMGNTADYSTVIETAKKAFLEFR
ncbi:MAG: aldehyde dehydrogenase family protein, partial [Cruoricaptor ignavus]|nr:aldehyde dehydrogenase family protein [Cruoricaptor ignavus]